MRSLFKKRRPTGSEKGFSLVEILVVIAIVGILASIALIAYQNQRQAAFTAALQTDLRNTGTAINGQGYYDGTLPEDVQLSEGNTIIPMRLSANNNYVANPLITSPETGAPSGTGWHTNRGSEMSREVRGAEDGWSGNSYLRATRTGGMDNANRGFYLRHIPEGGIPNGSTWTMGAAVRVSEPMCVRVGTEFNPGYSGGTSQDIRICFSEDGEYMINEWYYWENTSTNILDGKSSLALIIYESYRNGHGGMPMGASIDVTGGVIVEGESTNLDWVFSQAGHDFCLEGHHESDPSNIWHYSNLTGGLGKGKC